ncbi:MAG: ornithine carbamoyltransferase [Candidatus Omnitrophica bacterium]|nr:ornithine carbamoyltransferase [Candidatus Omnitrophota bacterium]MBU4140509.1 ornithine carbamoyltransferase [Candidatus Omnitrophota bacterium]
MKRDLISIKDLKLEEIEHIFNLTSELKAKVKDFGRSLSGRSLGLIFLKPSLRTRVSFEVGMSHLGGHTVSLTPEETKFGTREAVKDFGSVLSRYLDALVVRTFSHSELEELAGSSDIPVINGLTDLLHPCQALSDLYTIREKKGSLGGINLAFIGDGNNVAHSLLYGCAKLGVNLTVATPGKHKPKEQIFAEALELAKASGAKIVLSDDPSAAAGGADIIYTDVWTSMGQEAQCKKRTRDFQGFQVNQKLVSLAKPDCLVMHCLPAHRGEEITDEVIDGPNSIVFDQAENRMHLQKAILLFLLGGD